MKSTEQNYPPSLQSCSWDDLKLPFGEEDPFLITSSDQLAHPFDICTYNNGYYSSGTTSNHSEFGLSIQESVFETIPLMESFPTSPLCSSPMEMMMTSTTTTPAAATENVMFQIDELHNGYYGLDKKNCGGSLQGEEQQLVIYNNNITGDGLINHEKEKQIVLYDNAINGQGGVSGTVSGPGGDRREWEKGKKASNKRCRDTKISCSSSTVTSNDLSRQTISRYFYMPITQAAKELNVGLTLLKKRCREVGIPRWPHRKLLSLQTLIKNVKEMGKEEGDGGTSMSSNPKIRDAVEVLEQQRKLMEEMPEVELEEKTKKLRQACFKANYKKRRLMGSMADCQYSSSSTSSSH